MGVDDQTIEYIEEVITEKEFLNHLYLKFKNKVYTPKPIKRVYIPKPNGDKRPLGIPIVEDRVVQQAARMVIEPIFEATFKDCSFGFRPKRGAHDALREIKKEIGRKNYFIIDVDLKGYFDTIPHDKLITLVKQRITDRQVLKLIKSWLDAGILEAGEITDNSLVVPQGGVISPVLANVYLHYLDTLWEKKFSKIGRLIRYADDMVIICNSKGKSLYAVKVWRTILERLELVFNTEKSRILALFDGEDSFDFLGMTHRLYSKLTKKGKRYWYLQQVPTQKAMKNMHKKFRKYISPRHKLTMDEEDIIPGINRKVIGLRNYYDVSSQARQYLSKIDGYILELLVLHYNKRRNYRKKRSNYKLVTERVKKKLKFLVPPCNA